MRLIDADKLRTILTDEECPCALQTVLIGIIDEQPTAYDVDKVVKEINEWTFNANIDVGDGTVMNHNLIVKDVAIDIVKAGVTNESQT
jgi:hypothetical protein